ncbi:hypothetical protein EJB05_30797, partial [Eragrostis curvula]
LRARASSSTHSLSLSIVPPAPRSPPSPAAPAILPRCPPSAAPASLRRARRVRLARLPPSSAAPAALPPPPRPPSSLPRPSPPRPRRSPAPATRPHRAAPRPRHRRPRLLHDTGAPAAPSFAAPAPMRKTPDAGALPPASPDSGPARLHLLRHPQLRPRSETIPRLRYNLFPQEDEDGEGTSEVGGALGPSHQQAGYYIEAPVSSSDDSMHIPDTPINEGSNEVPETPSNEGDTEIISASSSPARNEAMASCPF